MYSIFSVVFGLPYRLASLLINVMAIVRVRTNYIIMIMVLT